MVRWADVKVTGVNGRTWAVLMEAPGVYVARDLEPGRYGIIVNALKFRAADFEGMVNSRERTVVRAQLAIESLSERITVKATPLEGQPQTQVGSQQEILDLHETRESPAKDIGEALSRLDGVWKIRKGGIANDIVIRGFQQGNVVVLMDGARVFGACPNHMDPAAFHADFAEVRDVVVTKGAFNIRDQGSLGGTANVETKEAAPGLQFTPAIGAGSYGFYNPSLTGSWAGDRFSFLGGYSYRRSDPFRDGRGNPITRYSNYQRPDDAGAAFSAGTAWFKGGFTAGGGRATVSYTRQAADDVLYPYLLMDAGYDNANRLGLVYERFGTGLARRIRAQAYLNTVAHWMTDALRVSSAGAARPYSMATFAGTRTAGARADAEIGGLALGGEIYRRGWTAVNTMRMMGRYVDQAAIPGVAQVSGGAYAEYARTVGRLRFSAGARLDFDRAKALSRSADTDLFWAYKGVRALERSAAAPAATASVSYSLIASRLDWFAAAGDTARFPDPQEGFFALRRGGSDWVGDPALNTVRNREFDMGLHLNVGPISLRPTLYYASVPNYITVHNQAVRNSVPGLTNKVARSYANVDARMYGGEFGYSVAFSSALLLNGGLGWTRGTKAKRPDLGIRDPDIAETPALKSRTSLRYGTRVFFSEVELLASAAQKRVDSDLNEALTPGFATFSVRGGVHSTHLKISGGIENVLNRFYYEHLSYQRDPFRLGAKVPEPGRSVFLRTEFQF
jgi:iron complex outermembrane receptor protein